MPRGKKFDAAEKHFEKKRVALERELKELKLYLNEVRKQRDALLEEREKLLAENEQLKQKVALLEKLANMTPEQSSAYLSSIARASELQGMMQALCGKYLP